MTDKIPGPVRALVLVRAGGRCERCGAYTDRLELHHRKFRSRGGLHTAGNLIALCGWGNHTGCHGWAHTSPLAADWGVSVHSWADPLIEGVWMPWLAAWRWLSDDGRLLPSLE